MCVRACLLTDLYIQIYVYTCTHVHVYTFVTDVCVYIEDLMEKNQIKILELIKGYNL